jgi:hypothetical protein
VRLVFLFCMMSSIMRFVELRDEVPISVSAVESTSVSLDVAMFAELRTEKVSCMIGIALRVCDIVLRLCAFPC